MDRVRAERFNDFREDGLGYLHLQSTRPSTLAYSLTDSPAAQLAWIVEKFAAWTDPAAVAPQDAVDVDQLLTNISVYWFTRSGASSAQFTYEGMAAFKAFVGEAGSAPLSAGDVPLGVAVFAGGQLDPVAARPGGHGGALDRVRPGRALPGSGGAGPAGRGPAKLLP